MCPALPPLLQPKINKILKTLEERLLVKSVKSVQNTSKKVGSLGRISAHPGPREHRLGTLLCRWAGSCLLHKD